MTQTARRGHCDDRIAAPRGPRILYLVHDLDDAAVWRRAAMLRLGGARVELVGFRRETGPLPGEAQVLGRTRNAQMAHRALAVLRQRLSPSPALSDPQPPDAIIARNLEMLALAVPLRRRLGGGVPLVYEVLDIHRLLIGESAPARLLRGIERRLCREVDRLIVSSPAFVREYFAAHWDRLPRTTLVENKVFLPELPAPAPREARPAGPLRLGWFGILRCRVSLDCLDRLTRAEPGRYSVSLRGRPALDEIPDFHERVAANPDLEFGGPYDYPDDLARIYGEVDLAWLVDRYDAGRNSDWLLPNRLYESGLNAVPPVGLEGTEVAAKMRELGIGVVIDEATPEAVHAALAPVTAERLETLRQRQSGLPVTTWATTEDEARDLLAEVLVADEVAEPGPPELPELPEEGVLLVVPALREVRHIRGVLESLVPFMQRKARTRVPARLVVADGGSDDGTREIVREVAQALPDLDIRLMDNPARLQSAGVNLACAEHGEGMSWLVRLDAHSQYPQDYVDVLLDEARRTGADSVVVAMEARGTEPLQKVIAAAQNSRLGNGGAAHRTGSAGRFVDHGHHALMRLAAFNEVGGYDEGFSHNEDAELDLRLGQAGYTVWLTGRTGLVYLPRRDIPALMRQYFRFGGGRARTLLKHRLKPRLRQAAMIALAPMLLLSVLTPLHPVFALPLAVWALACLAGGAALVLRERDLRVLAAGPIAGCMHLAWSVGFWAQLLRGAPSSPAPLPGPRRGAEVPPGTAAVGVCTFRRPALAETLRTLEAQDLPGGLDLCIIVADNDAEPSAREMVESFARTSRHEVVYRHAPAGNISVARNAVLEEAERRGLHRLAFIDDDELAPPGWLAALLGRLAEGEAEAVVGPVRALYGEGAPDWMRRARIHDTRPELGADGRPIAGHSCNVIMRTDAPSFAGRRFDLARGVSGGEDTGFFEAARRDGARLALAPEAWLEEPVTAGRARLAWLLRRKYRMGQTHGSLLREEEHRGRAALLLPATAKVAYCALAMLAGAPFPERRNAALLRGALHAGTVTGLLGRRPVDIYGEGLSEPGAAGASAD